LLFTVEDYRERKSDKDHRFFYYFSYYSLTVYISHNALSFIFWGLLPWYLDYLCVSLVILLYFFGLKKIYKSSKRNKISIKVAIGRLAKGAETRIEARKNKKE
jgi:asparagine N-glycosylation enzyme membrane subunit Stt3